MFSDPLLGKEILERSMEIFARVSKLPDKGNRSWYLARLGSIFLDGGDRELAVAAMDLVSGSRPPEDLESLTRCAILAVRLSRRLDAAEMTERIGSFGAFGKIQLECRVLPFRSIPAPEDLGVRLSQLELQIAGLVPGSAEQSEASGRLALSMLLISRQKPELLPGISDLEEETGEDPFGGVVELLRNPESDLRKAHDEVDGALMEIEERLRKAIPASPSSADSAEGSSQA